MNTLGNYLLRKHVGKSNFLGREGLFSGPPFLLRRTVWGQPCQTGNRGRPRNFEANNCGSILIMPIYLSETAAGNRSPRMFYKVTTFVRSLSTTTTDLKLARGISSRAAKELASGCLAIAPLGPATFILTMKSKNLQFIFDMAVSVPVARWHIS